MTNLVNYYFENRIDAGKKLGEILKQKDLKDSIVLALPRGGVVIADEVAKKLSSSLDIVVSRKIGAPGNEEFGIGAISEDEIPRMSSYGVEFFNPESPEVQMIVSQEKDELKRRINLYRKGHSLNYIKDKTVVLVDDGLATGSTAIAAAKFLRTLDPQKLILAVPVAPKDIDKELSNSFDEIICLYQLRNLRSVGLWYKHFNQVEDDQVLSILNHYH